MPAIEHESEAAQSTRASLRSAAWLALRLLAGLALLAISLWTVDLTGVYRQVAGASFPWLAAALLLVLLSIALKVLRWRWLLAQAGVKSGWRQAAESFLLGQAANIVLPIRGGDLVRIGWVSAGQPGAVPGAILATLIEKYLDLVALVVLLLSFGGSFLDVPAGWQIPALIVATGLLVAGMWAGPKAWKRLSPALAARAPAWLRPLIVKIDQMAGAIQAIKDPRRIAIVLGVTALTWITMILTNAATLAALGLPRDFKASALVLGLVYVGVAPALMPGNVGPFYFAVALAVRMLPVSEAQRIAFATLLYALTTFPPLILAGSYLLLMPVKQRSRLFQAQKRPG